MKLSSVGFIGLVSFSVGCSKPNSSSDSDVMALAEGTYSAQLSGLAQAVRSFSSQNLPSEAGIFEKPPLAEKELALGPPGWLGVAESLEKLARGGRGALCQALGPIAQNFELLQHAYVFTGANVSLQAGLQYAKGVDYVYDLYHGQFAAFHYTSHQFGLSVGPGTSAYVGLGFGKKEDVLVAWSGYFMNGSVDFKVPLFPKILSASALTFTGATKGESGRLKPDLSIWGGGASINASISKNVDLGFPVGNPTAGSAEYWPWNPHTEWKFEGERKFVDLARHLTGGSSRLMRKREGQRSHAYIQYTGASFLRRAAAQSLSMVATIPATTLALNVVPMTIGIAVLRDLHAQGKHLQCPP